MERKRDKEKYRCVIERELDINAKTKSAAKKKFLSGLKEDDVRCYKIREW